MWMMGYNDGGSHADFNMPDSFNGRKLRPLIPRPLPSANNTTTTSAATTTTIPPYLNRSIHHGAAPHEFLAQYHHLAAMAEQSKRSEFINTPTVVMSSRWNPTPEQLRGLEELYKRGTRTPSAEQIQQITAQLRKFGKIEGKNVFYWFQNHKARERQKRRRQMESNAADHQQLPLQISVNTSTDHHHHQNKESLGSRRTMYEVEQTKNWPPTITTTTLAPQESVSMERGAAKGGAGMAAAAAAAADQCCRRDGWIQFDEEELQQRRNFVEKNATWQQMMRLSSPPSDHHIHPSPSPTHLIINTSASTQITPPATCRPTVPVTTSSMDDQQTQTSINTKTQYYHHLLHQQHHASFFAGDDDDSQTLQLFPLRSGRASANADTNLSENINAVGHCHPNEVSGANMGAHQYPYPFFEFLPLKN